jgi:DNA polymerase IV
MATGRKILHVDMDAFYASVEQRDNPSLRGKPLVVGGGSNRGVVAAASYESRVYGIHSAMPMREAMRRCPALLSVRPRISHYKAVSEQIFRVFGEFTPLVEGLSLDEAFLDVSDSLTIFGTEVQIARRIKIRIREVTELTASVGVAPNKLVAKIASDLGKPDGLVVVTEKNTTATLDPLPVEVIPGIGRETLARLHAQNITSIADLRLATDRTLDSIFGRFAQRTRERAAGIDWRPVVVSRAEKSISAEETFEKDLDSVADLQRELLRLTEKTSQRLRAKHLAAGTLQLKIRQSDFSTFTRQRSLQPPANSLNTLYDVARQLLSEWLAEHPGARIRLLGVGGSSLVGADQLDLFAPQTEAGGSRVDQAVDDIRQRFGNLSVGRARSLNPD